MTHVLGTAGPAGAHAGEAEDTVPGMPSFKHCCDTTVLAGAGHKAGSEGCIPGHCKDKQKPKVQNDAM